VGIPLESYRIIEDRYGPVTNYFIAEYAVMGEWVKLRAFTQDL
jgi:hypothetical protein